MFTYLNILLFTFILDSKRYYLFFSLNRQYSTPATRNYHKVFLQVAGHHNLFCKGTKTKILLSSLGDSGIVPHYKP